MSRESGSAAFWDAAAPLLADELISEGTIMGGPCVRAGKEFVGMPHHKGPGIVVKLSRDRVEAMIADGYGKPFAPAGKVFREWVLVTDFTDDQGEALLRESVAFVSR